MKSDPVFVVDGLIKDTCGNHYAAKIKVYNEKNNLISTAKSNSVSGKFSFVIPFLLERIRINIDIPERRSFDYYFNPLIDSTFRHLTIPTECPKKTSFIMKDNPIKQKLFYVYFDYNIDTMIRTFHDTILFQFHGIAPEKIQSVKITGHTDSDGSDEYNKDLSKRRKESVYQYLIRNNFVRKEIIQTAFEGEKQHVKSNSSTTGRATNRKVQIVISYRME